MIDVELDGQTYQEMHVDGGAMAQVIVYPTVLHLREVEARVRATRERRLI